MLKVEYIVNSIFDSITWLLSETEGNQVWLVDCGDIKPILEWVGDREIAGVLLTHAHFDHICGLPELIKRNPNSKIYTNEIGRRTLSDARLNMSLYHETPLSVEGLQVQICVEGDEIPLFDGVKAIVFETPGHHPSCLSFMIKHFLFTGDAYIPGVKVVTKLPNGDRLLAQNSLEKIKILSIDKTICPGHTMKNQ